MNSLSTDLPSGLRIFSVLPDELLERLLTKAPLKSIDLLRLYNAAGMESLRFVQSAIETAIETRVRSDPHGAYLMASRRPNESTMSMLRFIERLDGAIDPCENTEIWSCGRNDSGQGARSTSSDANFLSRGVRLASEAIDFVAPPPCVILVAAGTQHSACITAHGTLHVTGANRRGQLGVGDLSGRLAWTPVLDLKCVRIAQVACGAAHTLALSGEGDLFVTGANDYGQLGLLNHTQHARFTKTLIGPVKMIAAGTAHSVALFEDGTAYSTGDNSSGQVGKRCGGSTSIFQKVSCFGREVVRVACGSNTTMLLTVDNMVLVTGKRRSGLSVIGGLGNSRVSHLGVGEGFAIASTDEHEVALSVHRKRFNITSDLVDIGASNVSAGISHCVIVSDDGSVHAFGANAFGQVAAGQMGLTLAGSQNARMIRPHRVPLTRVIVPETYRALQAAAGAFHTLYLLQRKGS